jgi:hypothetical protein
MCVQVDNVLWINVAHSPFIHTANMEVKVAPTLYVDGSPPTPMSLLKSVQGIKGLLKVCASANWGVHCSCNWPST